MTDIDIWYVNRSEVQQFAECLVESGDLATAHHVLEFFEKPHKWDREYHVWVKHDRPAPHHVGWDRVADELQKVNR